MKGVIASIAPDAPIIDITHGIPRQSIIAGALALRECWRFFPKRTVVLAVVDPGVGTAIAASRIANASRKDVFCLDITRPVICNSSDRFRTTSEKLRSAY